MKLDVAPPLQARSRQTYDAILEATERLLQSLSFDELGVAEIVRSAGISTGSFYARFASKEALLPVLYARYDADIGQRSADLVHRIEASEDLPAACAIVTEALASIYREKTNLMRAVVQLTRATPGAVQQVSRLREESHRAVERAMLRFMPGVPAAEAVRAIRAAQFMAVCALREAILFPNAPFAAATDARLDVENTVATMMARYIQGELQCLGAD